MINDSLIWTPARLAAAQARLEAWRGTRWRHRGHTLQQSVDCLHLITDVLTFTGICPAIELPRYKPNIGLRGADDKLAEVFAKVFHVEQVAVEDMKDGDIALFKARLSANHCGMMMGGKFWQCLYLQSVECYPLDDWKPKFHAAMRIIADGIKIDPSTLNYES